MRDVYLYEGTNVLKNLLNIKESNRLEEAEADYTINRLKELAENPIKGNYDWTHLSKMHKYIFQDVYDWAGQPREIDIEKEEEALGGLSIDYSKADNVSKDIESVLSEMKNKEWSKMNTHEKAIQFSDSLAKVWKVHAFREGNTRTSITFCCQYANDIGINIDKDLFAKNAQYVRRSLVAYNAVFNDLGDLSKPEFLTKIVEDAIVKADKDKRKKRELPEIEEDTKNQKEKSPEL